MTADSAVTAEPVLIDVAGLSVSYHARGRRRVIAVDGVDLSIRRGEVLCVVGESGSGKSTLGKAILRLIPSSGGSIAFDGDDLTEISGRALRRLRARMQMVFQDPYASLDPRMTVGDMLAEPLAIHGSGGLRANRERVLGALRDVGLPIETIDSYAHELSGGQRQRVGIARALILEPEFIVADEPVAALDVSIQAQVVNLLQELQRSRELTMLVISHDLAVVRHLADRVVVMYSGRIVEAGDREDVYLRPAHPYTQALLSAAPIPVPEIERARERIVLEGDPPSPYSRPEGCRFSSRCPLRAALGNPEICTREDPQLLPVGGSEGHRAACHFDGTAADADASHRAAVGLRTSHRSEEEDAR